MIGGALLIVTPRYPWYALLLIPFIALTGRWEWFAVPLALSLRQLVPDRELFAGALAAAVIVIVIMAVIRSDPARRRLARLGKRILNLSRS